MYPYLGAVNVCVRFAYRYVYVHNFRHIGMHVYVARCLQFQIPSIRLSDML